MTANVTREVAFAHSNLQGLCKTFEVDVDRLCALAFQSLRPHEFYESIRTAAKCADALSRLQAAGSHEDTNYGDRVAEAEKALSQRRIELIDISIGKINSIKQEVLSYSGVAEYVGVDFSTTNDIDPREFLKSEAEAEKRSTNTSYREALAYLKKSKARGLSDRKKNYSVSSVFVGIGSAIAFWVSGATFLGGFLLGVVGSVGVMFFYSIKKGDIRKIIEARMGVRE